MSGILKRVVAEEVKAARKAQNMEQKELAEKTGVSQQRISEIESGKHSIGLDGLEAIAVALGVSLKVFFEEEDLDVLDDSYHVGRSYVLPVALLKQLEAQASREVKSTNQYVIEALARQVKEDNQNFYRAVFSEAKSEGKIEINEEGWEKIAS